MMNYEEFTQACIELSDAILAGCALVPMIKGEMIKRDPDTRKIIGACTLGAAVLAKQANLPDMTIWNDSNMARKLFPIVDAPAIYPEGIADDWGLESPYDTVYGMIVTLNDAQPGDREWTREEIAAEIRKLPERMKGHFND